jgi:hypothetical protein
MVNGLRMPEMGKIILLFRGMPKCEEFEVSVLILEIGTSQKFTT